MARKLVVEIVGDASSLEKSFKQADAKTKTFGSSLGRVGKLAAFTAGGAALGGLALVLKKSVETANEHAKVYAQTNAVLKSTGKSAGVSAKQVSAFADATEKLTGIDDIAVQKGQNMLLTFTNLRNGVGKNNKIFTEASKTLVDMTVALGSDPQKQAIQLGKALNDPVKGVSALARVGVTFTKQQKATIAALVKGGKTAAAQKIILKELNKEFGGSAKAFGRTLPGQMKIFQARLDDIFQRIGVKLVPVLTKMLDVVSDLLAIFTSGGSATEKFQAALERFGISAKTSKRIIDDLKEAFHDIQVVVVGVFKIIRPLLDGWWQQIKNIVALIDDIVHGRWKQVFADLGKIVTTAFTMIKKLLVNAITFWGGLALRIGSAVKNKIVEGLKGLGSGILAAITRGLGGLRSFLERLIIGPINALIRGINSALGWAGVHINEIGTGGGGGAGTTQSGSPAHTGKRSTFPRPGGRDPVTGAPKPTFGRGASFAPGAAASVVSGGGALAAVHINGPVTVVANDPDAFLRELQKKARTKSASRTGRFGGNNLGLA